MTSLKIERYLPYVLTAFATAAWQFLACAGFPDEPSALLASTGTAAAVLVGFLATMNAIILSISGSPVFQVIRAAGYHEDLFRYVYEATIVGVALLCISIVGFFVVRDGSSPWAYNFIWVIFSTCSIFLFLRVSHITFKLLKQA